MAVSKNTATTVVLITGCSAGGIGHHLALEFATAHKCKVYASARDVTKISVDLQNKGITPVALDVTNQASVDSAIAFVQKDAGCNIDILVNNAGQICVSPVVEVDVNQAQRIFDTNVIGVTRVCKAVAPQMMDNRHGTIVNVGSVSGYATTPWVGYYAASKAALHMLTDAMRMELAPFNVRVVLLAPGGIISNLHANGKAILSKDSRYGSVRNQVDERAKLSQAGSATPTTQFASVVVPKLLMRNPPAYITYGNHSALMWIAYYLPWWMRDYFAGGRFGTRKLAQEMALSASSGNSSGRCPVTNPKVLLTTAMGAVGVVAFIYIVRTMYLDR
ncbi:hypothetical protein IW140_005881 [Coemansia sp. RSA 1813]|nr:hypothetical protein EV178_005314 [Coemansia sp. RSA 1646]KAJ1766103.1 hypothetical protein LPJ74_006046 [Coemansia sp. RSA 1843]KAJ2086183.1 hypothetical protein IW138_005855 [Coemansia sp. RSA 986]KAJ2210912.1 hypothetical protein EV179_005901 [Coemansia sp. RSA 487]KAJ2564063.1 hypothetical protein IW140_005881 [Coemansia sp. RSA 1813]